MNLVDSCGWLEYFADEPNAAFFAPAIEDKVQQIVPSICLYEVYKRILQQRSERDALRAVAIMQQGRVIDLDARIALSAARNAMLYKLAMADSVIYTVAQIHQAKLWTQDAHFKGLAGVRYAQKQT